MDDNEIRRLIAELGLMNVACEAVYIVIGSTYPGDVKQLAVTSITELFTDAIDEVVSDQGIIPLLRVIARRKAIDFLKVAFRRYMQHELEEDRLVEEPEDRPFRIQRDLLAEGLRLETFDLQHVVPALVEHCQLTPIQEALLVEHIIGDTTQEEFAAHYGLPLGSIGGLKNRVLKKIRSHLVRMSPAIFTILRRNGRRAANR